MGKRERKSEGKKDQGRGWRLETHLYQTLEKRKERRHSQRGISPGRSKSAALQTQTPGAARAALACALKKR